MATLRYDIVGSNDGISNAVSGTIGILNNLQKVADNLKINLFRAETKQDIDSIGGALTIITGKINEYVNTAIKGSQAFKDQTAQAALDALSTKLTILTGNAQLFGTTIQNSQAQIKAYQDTINRLLGAGLDPLDQKITSLKANIDSLTKSVNDQKAAAQTITDPYARFAATGSLILDAENKVKNLTNSLRAATNTRDIAQYNVRLEEARSRLADLNAIGTRTAQTNTLLAQSATRAGGGFNSVGVELGRVVQDLPYAANNFGAVGNNITRIVEVLPGYLAQTRAMIIANGGAATSANVAKTAFAGLFTGFGGISLAISAIVSGFVIYQQVQQASARAAAKHTDEIQKQKKALDDYIGTLDSASKSSAKAADNYATEVTKLDVLFSALNKNTNARYGTVSALEELQKTWPQEFGNLKEGERLTLNAADAYLKLRNNLVAAGTAQAAQSLSADAQKSYVQNTIALNKALPQITVAQENYNKALANLAVVQKTNGARADIGNSALDAANAAVAKAKSAFNNATDQVATFRIEAFKARQDIAEFNKAAADAQNKITTPVKGGLVYDLERQIKLLQDQQPLIKNEADLAKNVADIKSKQLELDRLLGKGHSDRVKTAEKELNLIEQLNAIQNKVQKSSTESGLTGYQAELQKIFNFYLDINRELNSFNTKVKAQQDLFNRTGGKQGISNTSAQSLLDKSNSTKAGLVDPFNKEIADKRIAEAKRVSDEIQRINNEFGVKAEQSRAKEILQINAKYDAEVVKAQGNADILAALDKGRLNAIQAVNDKYIAIAQDLQDKILAINDLALATTQGKEEYQTQRIENEWNRRKQAAQDYYDKLKELSKTGNGAVDAFNGLIIDAQATVTGKNTDEAKRIDKNAVLNKDLNQVVGSFVNSFTNSLFQANSQVGANFQSVFANITQNFAITIQSVVIGNLSKSLQEGINKGVSGLAPQLQKIIGGLAIAGGLISGLTPKTSAVGQGLGGALSGAATGVALGTAVAGPAGALVGGIVGGIGGLLGGIFGSSSARKEEEERQKQMLAEQKKQTEYLSLAYTSQIIGRATANGVVTGISVGAFGQLVATISGKDLQFVLDRNQNGR